MGSDKINSANQRKLLFLTGTRADFGKLKSLIRFADDDDGFDCTVFVTGMHTLELYGQTTIEVQYENFNDVHIYYNQYQGEPMEQVLANTISGLSRFVHEHDPDMIIVHGDRIEALAGAIVGSLRNILVAHIEGGEISGTVDELIRHAVTKLSHIHFVANDESADRLRQLGEKEESIFTIGSPDIDIMASDDLPTIGESKKYYQVEHDAYVIALFHPVTTEVEKTVVHAHAFVDALIESGHKYLVVYPNNDEGSHDILRAYDRLDKLPEFRVLPSIRFEYFLTFLKHCRFFIGNSSTGIREAPFYSKPTVNVGTRQRNRSHNDSIINVGYAKEDILAGIAAAESMQNIKSRSSFGNGKSLQHFINALRCDETWRTPTQKQFMDITFS